MFDNPFFHSLLTEHAHLAIGLPPAVRYPADVIPFAALAEPTPEAMLALANLLAPGEVIHVVGDGLPSVDEIEYMKPLPCLQYHFSPDDMPKLTLSGSRIRPLTAADAPAMVALTDIAFPGYFRPRAGLLGPFFGIHLEGNSDDEADGQLIAMAGTRVCLPGHREISAVCTHPAHLGQGHAAALTQHVLRCNASDGVQSFLHVLAANHRAVALYERLGFTGPVPVLLNQLRRG